MKLSTILKEVSDQQSREMITGIADILRDVKDEGNRKEIAKRMIKKFDREGVKYNAEEFLKLCGVGDTLKELNVPQPEDAYALSKPRKSVTQGNLLVYKYHFKNRKGNDISIETNFDTDKSEMYVVFYESDKEKESDDDLKYGTKTGSGDMLKVLATVVEAVKRTAEDLGGMRNVKAILIQSDDPKRFEVYAHYAETLFPDFTVEKVGTWIYMTNKKYEPTNKQLKEIGEATAAPYPFKSTVRDPELDEYEFVTDAGNKYVVLIEKYTKEGERDYDVQFGIIRNPERVDNRNPFLSNPFDTDREVNDPKNLFRVMATVVAAVKRSIQLDEKSGKIRVAKLIMLPTKRDASDTRRTQLYKKYIDKHMPAGSVVSVDPDGSRIQVELPKK